MHARPLISIPILLLAICMAGCQTHDPRPATREVQEKLSLPADACQASDELARLDPRTPVPLLPMMAWHQKQNMMEHLVAIQRITEGLAREDWDEIASASERIGTSPQMEEMCTRMGAGAEGFTELALEFHQRADAITVAARAHDSASVLRATATTLQMCTACHATYRQDIVTTSWR